MTEEDARDLVAFLIERADELKPVISELIDAVGTFEPEIKRVLEGITDAAVDCKVHAINRLIYVHGFSKEEAIQIALRMESDIFQAAKNVKVSRSK